MTGITIIDDFLLFISSILDPDVTDDIAWDSGKPIGRIDLVEIETGIFARRDIATNYFSMRDAAKNDGITIKAYSGFRSYSKQEKLYNAAMDAGRAKGLDTPYPPTAKPGYSNHQRGTALDIYVGMTIEDLNNNNFTPEFNWLAKNAKRFGFIRLPSEPWHYSNDGR